MANPLYTSVDPRIIDVHWFTPGQVPVIPGTLGSVFNQLNSPVEFCIGVVVVEDEITHERKGYIGIGNGIDEKADIRRVLDWGSPIIPRIIEEITADMGLSQSHADKLEKRVAQLEAALERADLDKRTLKDP